MWCFSGRFCRDLCLGKALLVKFSALTQSWCYSPPTDDTDNINKIIGSNSPEKCLSYLVFLEKKGDPRLMDVYTRVFSNMPLAKHCQNESYARMLVRFAELKAWVWDYNNTLPQMPHSEQSDRINDSIVLGHVRVELSICPCHSSQAPGCQRSRGKLQLGQIQLPWFCICPHCTCSVWTFSRYEATLRESCCVFLMMSVTLLRE